MRSECGRIGPSALSQEQAVTLWDAERAKPCPFGEAARKAISYGVQGAKSSQDPCTEAPREQLTTGTQAGD